jgi:hypothetical protein
MCSMGFSDLPETKGTVDRILLDADGNIQGFVLAGGLYQRSLISTHLPSRAVRWT